MGGEAAKGNRKSIKGRGQREGEGERTEGERERDRDRDRDREMEKESSLAKGLAATRNKSLTLYVGLVFARLDGEAPEDAHSGVML